MTVRRISQVAGSTAFVLSLLAAPHVAAADFYVDPTNGSDSGDGSSGSPWKSLQAVIDADLIETQDWASLPYSPGGSLEPKNAGAPVKAGDTIWLKPGDHGTLSIQGHYNSADITIAAESGDARFSNILIRGSGHWVLRGVTVSSEFATPYDNKTLIDVDSHAHRGPAQNITVEDCTLYSVADASGWSASDWDQKSANGMNVDGTDITVRNNQLRNVNFGISVGATDSHIVGNTIDGFAGDGLRGLGDHTVFEYNTVKNCYDVNDNHDDGFQSWSTGPGGVGTGEVTGIVVRGNTIINYEDPNQPMRCTLQGIGLFDGTFVDWVIENNVIMVDHWHGITLLGARGSVVRNNTVMDLNSEKPGPPWIKIAPHKNGTEASMCVVRNNLATSIANEGGGVTEDHNVTFSDASEHFVDAPNHDLHLLETSSAVDAADAADAPPLDRDRIPRPQGSAPDVGAYEWHDGSVMPMGGSTSGGSSSGGSGTGGTGMGGSGTGGANAGGTNSAGTNGGGNGGTSNGGTSNANGGQAGGDAADDGGCGCRTTGGGAPRGSGWLLLLGLGAALRRALR